MILTLETLEDAQKGAKDIRRTLESKQLKANMSSVQVTICSNWIEEINEVSNPIKMGDHTIENSTAEKHSGDKILEDGTEEYK